MSRNVIINLYLRPFSIAIYESSICTICAYSDVFLVSMLYNSGLLIMPLVSDHPRFMASVDIGDF